MKRNMKRKLFTWFTIISMLICLISIPDMGTSKAAGTITLSGIAHVQTYGNKAATVTNQSGIQTLVLGTRGMGKRVESVTINMGNRTGYSGTLEYRVHRQTYGWTGWIKAGNPAGTTGQGKRLEAIEMRLTGALASHYDVRYRAHIQTYGDNQGWVYNGALAGTTGEAKRLEEIQVQIIPKSSVQARPSVSYRVHRQTYGWEKTWAKDGGNSGTTGEGKRLEGISITVNDNQYGGGIKYQTHVQSYGWMDWVSNGEMSGTQGEAKRLEAIRIKLTGELANHYDVYYRVHVQTYGWLQWVKNGECAGTYGKSKRLESIQIKLTAKTSGSITDAELEAYMPILDEYRNICITHQYNRTDENNYAENNCKYEIGLGGTNIGYCLKNIAGDNRRELLIVNGGAGHKQILAAYNPDGTNIFAGWSRCNYKVYQNGKVYEKGSSGARSSSESIYTIKNGKLICEYNLFHENGKIYYDQYGRYTSAYDAIANSKKGGVKIITSGKANGLIRNSIGNCPQISLDNITYFR